MTFRSGPVGGVRNLAALVLACLAQLLIGLTPLCAQETSPGLLRPGDGVVTGFAGTKVAPGPLPADAHPLDYTFIDLDGTTAQILDLSRLGGPARGQLAEPLARLRLKAGTIGHVFGIAIAERGDGGPPDIYLAATSVFGLPLVRQGDDGAFRRTLTGGPGVRFMPGLFGPGGGPRSIWKVDGRTGAASLLASLPGNYGTGSAGLGGLAVDGRSGSLYVADLESGRIHRLTRDGRVLDSFDHGEKGRPKAGLAPEADDPARRADILSPSFRADDPSTWGFATRSRLVFAVQVWNGRLYYSLAEGPQIWSVGLGPDGGFQDDARLEVDVAGTPAGNMITDIAFDGAGNLYIAQRGATLGGYDYAVMARTREALVARYRWLETERRWVSALEEYGVGLAGEHRSATGGVALGFGYDGNGLIDRNACRSTLWVTGEHLRAGDAPRTQGVAGSEGVSERPSGEIAGVKRAAFTITGPRIVHGLQAMAASRVRPESDPPAEAWFIDLDGRFEDAEVAGHVGKIAIYAPPCTAPPPEQTVDRSTLGGQSQSAGPAIEAAARCRPTAFGGRVRCTLDVRNVGSDTPTEDVVVRGTTRVLYGPDAGRAVPIEAATPDGLDWSCAAAAGEEAVCRLPAAALRPGQIRSIEITMDSRPVVVGGNMGLRSCLTLAHPNGHRHICAEAGIELAVRKSGPAECAAGELCRFAMAITNNSPFAYSGPLVLADRATIDGKAVALEIEGDGGFACEGGGPTADPFVCRTTISLAPGETRSYWASLRMPSPGGYWLQSCFGAIDPALLADPGLIARIAVIGGQGGAHPSCVWTRAPRPPGEITTSSVIPLLPPVCADGGRRLADGRCACPLSAPWSSELGRCQPLRPVCADAARTRDDGSCCPSGLVWLAGQRQCGRPEICPDPLRRTPDGGCCRWGFVWSGIDGRCVPPFDRCPDGRPVPPNGFCGCPPGTFWSTPARRCVLPPPVCPDITRRRPDGSCCDAGTRWNPALRRCAPAEVCPPGQRRPDGGCCPAGSRWNAITRSCGGEAVCLDPARRMPAGPCCPAGTVWSQLLGRCRPPATLQPCPTGQHRNQFGRCVPADPPPCPNGQHRVGSRCVADGPPPCPGGQHRVGTRCVADGPPPCPGGQHRNQFGRCVSDAPPPCPGGQHRVGSRCVSDGPPPCPGGQHRVGARCVPNAPPPCPNGTHRVGTRCLPTVINRKTETRRPSRRNGQPIINGVPIPRLNFPNPGGLPRIPGR